MQSRMIFSMEIATFSEVSTADPLIGSVEQVPDAMMIYFGHLALVLMSTPIGNLIWQQDTW